MNIAARMNATRKLPKLFEGFYHPGMQTSVISVTYEWGCGIGVLYQSAGCCTDMSGCIAFFERIDPNVQTIVTVAGLLFDAVYVKRDGEWQVGNKETASDWLDALND